MLKKLKKFMFLILLAFFVLPIAACNSPYDSIKISLSTSISQITNGRVELIRETTDKDLNANVFTISANVSAKKGVSTDLSINVDKPDLVKILDTQIQGSKTIVTCEAIGAGEAQVKFVSYGGKSESLNVYVNEPLRSVTVDSSYRPYIIKGQPFKFDTSKILYNTFEKNQGAVEPNAENKQVTFRPDRNGVTYNANTNTINVSRSFNGNFFNLEVRPVNGAPFASVTFIVLDAKDATNSNFNIYQTNSPDSLYEQRLVKKQAQNGIVDIDVALFPTDVDYKSAILRVKDYAIEANTNVGSSTNVPKTVFEFKEVRDEYSNDEINSGFIEIKSNEFAPDQIVISANEYRSEKAYINVYAALQGSENSTRVLIARIRVTIKAMPNLIVLRDTLGEQIQNDTLDVYNELRNLNFQKVNVSILEGTNISDLNELNCYIELSENIRDLIEVIGATEVSGSVGLYVIEDFNNFGFRIRSGKTLKDIENATESSEALVAFYASKNFGFEGSSTNEIIFNRTTKVLKLNLQIIVDEVKFK